MNALDSSEGINNIQLPPLIYLLGFDGKGLLCFQGWIRRKQIQRSSPWLGWWAGNLTMGMLSDFILCHTKSWLLISALSKVLCQDWPTIFPLHIQMQVNSIHSRPKKTTDLFQPLGRVRVTEAPLRDTGCHLIVCSLFEGIASRFCNVS